MSLLTYGDVGKDAVVFHVGRQASTTPTRRRLTGERPDIKRTELLRTTLPDVVDRVRSDTRTFSLGSSAPLPLGGSDDAASAHVDCSSFIGRR